MWVVDGVATVFVDALYWICWSWRYERCKWKEKIYKFSGILKQQARSGSLKLYLMIGYGISSSIFVVALDLLCEIIQKSGYLKLYLISCFYHLCIDPFYLVIIQCHKKLKIENLQMNFGQETRTIYLLGYYIFWNSFYHDVISTF